MPEPSQIEGNLPGVSPSAVRRERYGICFYMRGVLVAMVGIETTDQGQGKIREPVPKNFRSKQS
jgi:hypothetical protein